MDVTPFEIEIEVVDPDAAAMWIRDHFPGSVTNFKAMKDELSQRWRCTLIGTDEVVATAIKLYWDRQDA